MALLLVDIINSMIQAVIISYSIECCIRDKGKINKIKLFFMTIIVFVICSSFTSIWGNLSICVFIIHAAILGAIIIMYKENRFKGLIPFTLIYCFISIYAIIVSNLFYGVIRDLVLPNYIEIAQICTIYLPEIILIYLWIKYTNSFIQLYKLVISERINIIVAITISFCLDFVLAFYLIIYNDEANLLKSIIITTLCIFLAIIITYFGKIKRKSYQIFRVNEALESKNSELRKVKHDYGTQISYLYDLCLMEKFGDLKKVLKDIINESGATPTEVVSSSENSVLSLALKPAVDAGIHVIIEENCDFSLISITEMELYRVVSNIVNNAIKAMNGEGIIIARSYESLGNIVISIENNGPKILEKYLQHIFKIGFTTKENKEENHGYGLSIVKDLVESCAGKIYVKSNDLVTEFKIILPIR